MTILSAGFLFLFIAFNSAANLSGQALKNDGFESLGFYTMATLYLVFAFCSFFSSAFVNKVGAKLSLFIGGLCYAFWILCFLPPAMYPDHKADPNPSFLYNKNFIYFLSLFSAAINGFGAGILWVAQGNYVAECATNANKGFFFGYFWAFFMCSQVLGNLIAALILGNLAQSTYYIVMTIVAFTGTGVFLLLKKPIKSVEDLPQIEVIGGEKDGEHLGVGEGQEDDSMSLIRKEDESRRLKNGGFKKDVAETFRLLISQRMLYIMPLILWSGMSGAAYSGSFVPLMHDTMIINHPEWNENKKLSISLFAMISFGVSEMLGGLIQGKVSDKYGYRTSLYLVLAFTAVAYGAMIATIQVFEFTALTFFMTFAWGL
jgi:MFS family permease